MTLHFKIYKLNKLNDSPDNQVSSAQNTVTWKTGPGLALPKVLSGKDRTNISSIIVRVMCNFKNQIKESFNILNYSSLNLETSKD